MEDAMALVGACDLGMRGRLWPGAVVHQEDEGTAAPLRTAAGRVISGMMAADDPFRPSEK